LQRERAHIGTVREAEQHERDSSAQVLKARTPPVLVRQCGVRDRTRRLDDTHTVKLRYLGRCRRNCERRHCRYAETPREAAPHRHHGTFTDFTFERLLMLPAASYARTE